MRVRGVHSATVTGPILTLVVARSRRRGLTSFLLVGAVAAAVALVGVVAGIGAIATERTLSRALSAEGAARPVVRISHFSSSGGDREAVSGRFEAVSGPLERHALPAVRGVLMRELTDRQVPLFLLLVAVDEPGPWTTILDGRLPAPCTPQRCEALLASEVAAPPGFVSGHPAEGLELPIVGRGLLDPAVPFERLDQSGAAGERPANDSQTERRAPAILLVNGVDALASMAALDRTGRTYVWTAGLRPDAIHAWTADDLISGLSTVTRRLTEDDRAFTVSSPAGRIGDELARAEAARGRMLLISSLAVSILLAFAVFAALVGRADLAAELARLRAVGARRVDLGALIVLEAMLPVGVAGVLGALGGLVTVAVLAASQQVPIGPLLENALLAPEALVAAVVTMAAAAVATIAVTTPSLRGRGFARTLGAVGVTAVVLLGWQLSSAGALEPAALARSLANPAVIVVPSALAFLVALAFLAVLPQIFRALARRLRRAPLPVRLSILSVSRDPERPAATVTLLAFSLGAIVFALGWSASLRQGIVDQAAYRSGLDMRVTELGTPESISQSVVPVERYDLLGDDVRTMPVFRGHGDVAPGGGVAVLGVDPSVLPDLPGWRADFSDRPITALASAIEVASPPGGWRQAGHRLPATDPLLRLRFDYAGESLRLAAVVETLGGDHASIELGTIGDGMTSARATLPAAAIGGTLIALNFRHDRFIYGPHQHELRRATVTFHGLDGLVDARPIALEVFSVAMETIRAPQATDGLALPAMVSPDLATAVDEDGLLRLEIGGATVNLRVVSTVTAFPTVVEARPRFVVVALQPWLMALNAEAPGAGRPTEMWLGTPTHDGLLRIRAGLAGSPFRFPVVTDQMALVAERTADPLSESIVWALVVAALAGLVLSVAGILLGAAADLRDETGELADLETQGVAPSTLRTHAVLRTAWLAGGGAIAGVIVGVLLAATVTAALAVTAEGTLPIPSMRVVLPMAPILAGVTLVLAAVLGAVAWLARRRYADRHGAPGQPHRPLRAPRAGPGTADG